MVADFKGFPEATFKFLRDISRNNDKAWFDTHRADYEAGYVEPARAFVAAIGPELRKISRTISFDPKINGSIFRIQRDVRFAKDKRPYKDHLDLWFWHGDKRGWDTPGFFMRLSPDRLTLGAGMHKFDKPILDQYRRAVTAPMSSEALVIALDAVRKAGPYEIGGATRKTVPKGYDIDPDRTKFLLHEGLWAEFETDAGRAGKPDFTGFCLKHFAAMQPVSAWLLTEVINPG